MLKFLLELLVGQAMADILGLVPVVWLVVLWTTGARRWQAAMVTTRQSPIMVDRIGSRHRHGWIGGVAARRLLPWLWRADSDNCLGTNPGGTLGAAGLLVDPSLPDGQVAKSCIITMVVMHPLMDGLSVKQ